MKYITRLLIYRSRINLHTSEKQQLFRFYLNSLFDLQLGNYATSSAKRFAAEMSVLFLPMSSEKDIVELDVQIPDSYRDYLYNLGLGGGVSSYLFSGVKQHLDGYKTIVWGWNKSVIKRLGKVPAYHHPSFHIVKQVNSRQFSAGIALHHGFGVPGSQFCQSMQSVDAALADGEYPKVIKPLYGNAGYGFILVHAMDEYYSKRERIERHCRQGGVVVEPWCTRLCDISTGGEIDMDGVIRNRYMHRQWVNSFGAFVGIYIENDDSLLEPWAQRLTEVTDICFSECLSIGYTGYAGVDSFVYTHNKETDIAAGIEINGRCTMGIIAQAIRNKLSPGKCFLLRFISRRRCRLPDNYKAFNEILGEYRYRGDTGEGIVLLSPLRSAYQGVWREPVQHIFAIAAYDEARITEYDTVLQRTFL